MLISTPLRDVRYPEGVTAAEREIIDLLLEGCTIDQIAAARETSSRTITTQLSRIYRKARVGSLRELAAFTSGVDGPWNL